MMFSDKWHLDKIKADACKVTDLSVVCKLKYIPDGAHDYWQTPSETNALGGGDCEDLSIAWLHAYYKTGAPLDMLTLIIGNTPDRGHHAVGRSGKVYFDCRGVTARYRIHSKLPPMFTPLWELGFDGVNRICTVDV